MNLTREKLHLNQNFFFFFFFFFLFALRIKIHNYSTSLQTDNKKIITKKPHKKAFKLHTAKKKERKKKKIVKGKEYKSYM